MNLNLESTWSSRVVGMSIRLECTKTELQLAPTHNEYRNLMSCYIVVHIHIQNLIYFHISDSLSIKFIKLHKFS